MLFLSLGELLIDYRRICFYLMKLVILFEQL